VNGSHKGHCLTTYLSDWVNLLFSCSLFYLSPCCVFGGSLTQVKSLKPCVCEWMRFTRGTVSRHTWVIEYAFCFLVFDFIYCLCMFGGSLTLEKSLQTLCVWMNAIYKGNCLKTYLSDWVNLLFSFFLFFIVFLSISRVPDTGEILVFLVCVSECDSQGLLSHDIPEWLGKPFVSSFYFIICLFAYSEGPWHRRNSWKRWVCEWKGFTMATVSQHTWVIE
jgi:hypothetical protein